MLPYDIVFHYITISSDSGFHIHYAGFCVRSSSHCSIDATWHARHLPVVSMVSRFQWNTQEYIYIHTHAHTPAYTYEHVHMCLCVCCIIELVYSILFTNPSLKEDTNSPWNGIHYKTFAMGWRSRQITFCYYAIRERNISLKWCISIYNWHELCLARC